jgi:hypothetical protein
MKNKLVLAFNSGRFNFVSVYSRQSADSHPRVKEYLGLV